jgi:hypothetical protein
MFSVIPAYDFYKNLLSFILGNVRNLNLEFSKSFIDIITGFLLGVIFLLFLKSKTEYIRIKEENIRMREMFLAIHIFDNIRFNKMKSVVPNLFVNEEQELKQDLKKVFMLDIGREYTDNEIENILDCFYRNKPKFQ